MRVLILGVVLATSVVASSVGVIPPGASVSYTVSDGYATVPVDLPTWMTTDGLNFATCDPGSECYGDDALMAPMVPGGPIPTSLDRQGSGLGIMFPTLSITALGQQGVALGIEYPYNPTDPINSYVAKFPLDDIDTFGTFTEATPDGIGSITLTVAAVEPSDLTPEPQTWALLGTGLLFAGFLRKRFQCS